MEKVIDIQGNSTKIASQESCRANDDSRDVSIVRCRPEFFTRKGAIGAVPLPEAVFRVGLCEDSVEDLNCISPQDGQATKLLDEIEQYNDAKGLVHLRSVYKASP